MGKNENLLCLRCGTCCKGHLCLVPKNEDSDLSPENLSRMEPSELVEYLDNNTEEQGEKCKWLLQDNVGDVAKCLAYDRKSSMCIDHRSNKHCNIGFVYWKRYTEQGGKIPIEIEKDYREHPLYSR